MSLPKNSAAWLLLLGLAVAGVGLLNQRATTNNWETRALTAEARLQRFQTQAARAKRTPTVNEASEGGGDAKVAVDRDDVKRARKAAKEQARAESRVTAVGGAGAKESREEWIANANDPTVLRRLNEQARLQTLKRYGALMDQLALTPPQREELTKLLTDERQVALDIAASSFQRGVDPREDPATYLDLIAATRQDLDAQVHALLGDAGYAAYQNSDRSAGQAQVLGRLDQLLRAIDAPLSPAQATQLQQTMQTNKTGRVTAKVVNDAKTFLSAAQLQTLRDLRALQQANSQKRNQPVPVLPVGEGGK